MWNVDSSEERAAEFESSTSEIGAPVTWRDRRVLLTEGWKYSVAVGIAVAVVLGVRSADSIDLRAVGLFLVVVAILVVVGHLLPTHLFVRPRWPVTLGPRCLCMAPRSGVRCGYPAKSPSS